MWHEVRNHDGVCVCILLYFHFVNYITVGSCVGLQVQEHCFALDKKYFKAKIQLPKY